MGSKFADDPDYVVNPTTGRWVKKSGTLGRKITTLFHSGAQTQIEAPTHTIMAQEHKQNHNEISVEKLLESYMRLTNKELLIKFISKHSLDPQRRNKTTLAKIPVKELKALFMTSSKNVDQSLIKGELLSTIENIMERKDEKIKKNRQKDKESAEYLAKYEANDRALKKSVDEYIKIDMIGPLVVSYLSNNRIACDGEGSQWENNTLTTNVKLIKKEDNNVIVETLEDLDIEFLSLNKYESGKILMNYEDHPEYYNKITIPIGTKINLVPLLNVRWSGTYSKEIQYGLNFEEWL